MSPPTVNENEQNSRLPPPHRPCRHPPSPAMQEASRAPIGANTRASIETPRQRSRITQQTGTPPTPVHLSLPLQPSPAPNEAALPLNGLYDVVSTPYQRRGTSGSEARVSRSTQRPPPPHARVQRHTSRTTTADGAARAARLCVGLLHTTRQASELQRWVDSAEGVRSPLELIETIIGALQAAEDGLSRIRACVEGSSQRENACASLLRDADRVNALREARELGSRRTPAVTMLLQNLLTSV